ncbi:putative zinc metalloproteinase in scaA 5'region [Nymphon striatum]|nr:putative zinc metalloproteinase in scaA 5'region [Nymphon striatum]
MTAQVVIGDTLMFNVQGVLMETKVASIRTVDWGRMQLNFSVVFPEGILEKAPQFHVITTNAPDEKASAQLQRELVTKFPNVSVIDLRQVLTVVQGILDKISWVINFMAFFSILTGIIVLIGSTAIAGIKNLADLQTVTAKNPAVSTPFLGLGVFADLNNSAMNAVYLGPNGLGLPDRDFYLEQDEKSKEIREEYKKHTARMLQMLGDSEGQLYVDAKFPPEAKAKAEKMIANVIEAFKERIQKLDWMGAETKTKAIEKLDKFTVKIAYPNEWEDYSTMMVAANKSYFENRGGCKQMESIKKLF